MAKPRKMTHYPPKYVFTDETFVEPKPVYTWAYEKLQKDVCAGMGIPMSTFETKLMAEFFKTEPEGDPITSMVHDKLKAAITDMPVDSIWHKFNEELGTHTTASNPNLDAESLMKIYEQIFALPPAPTTSTNHLFYETKAKAPEPEPTPSPTPCRPFGEPSPRKLIL